MKVFYLMHLTHSYSHKNKIEKDIHEFFAKHDRIIVDADQLDYCKKMLTSEVNELNKKHHRCKPVSIEFRRDDPTNGDVIVSLNNGSILGFTFRKGTYRE